MRPPDREPLGDLSRAHLHKGLMHCLANVLWRASSGDIETWAIDELKVVSVVRQSGVRPGCSLRQSTERLLSSRDHDAAGLDELAVPELQVTWPGAATLDPLQQVVTLYYDALVSLNGAEVLAVHLGNQDVHVPAAQSRGTVHHVEVLRAEHDGVDFSNQLGRPAGDAVDPGVFLDVEAFLRIASVRLGDGVLEIDLDPNWAVFALHDRGDLREELYAHGLASDKLALGRSALGLGDDEEVQGFEKVALAVPVVALHEHHPRPQVDFQPFKVPYVEEREMRKVDGEASGSRISSCARPCLHEV